MDDHSVMLRRRSVILVYLATMFHFADSFGLRSRRRSATLAVVRPFWAAELSTLEGTLLASSAPKACENGPLPVDLVLYYAEGSNSTVDLALRSLAEKLAHGSCYQEVHVKYAGIEEDVAYPASPCTQFVDMFTTKPSPLWGYSAIYLMELDVQPVQDNWLKGILPVMHEAALGKVWVAGGVYNLQCMVTPRGRSLWQKKLDNGANASYLEHGSKWWNNRHINGNGVYSSSADFVEWVKANWGRRQGGPGAATDRCESEGGYDEIMFLEAKNDFRGTPGGRARWREDGRFMDCKPVGEHKTAHTMESAQLRNTFPEALLVHSSGGLQHRSVFIQF